MDAQEKVTLAVAYIVLGCLAAIVVAGTVKFIMWLF